MLNTPVYSDSIASGASTSSGINFQAAFGQMLLEVGTMSTAAAIGIQHSADGGTTWKNVFHPTIQSATVATPQMFIASGVGTNGGTVVFPITGFKQVRFIATAVVSGGVQFKAICSVQI